MSNRAAETTELSTATIIERIDEVLAKRDMRLVHLDGEEREEHGEYVLIPIPSLGDLVGHGPSGPLGRIERENVDIVQLARELRVLRRR